RTHQENVPRGPATGSEEQEPSKAAVFCHNCRLEPARGYPVQDCAHRLCDDCYLVNPSCPVCTQSPVEGTIVGNMSYGILNSTLEGHEHDLTLKIIYNIQDGTQQRCDPNPGRPYRGGCFEAFLPNNKQGRKVLQLLTKAFYKGFIFKIISLPSGEEKVTWNNIPHKTSITGGKIRYVDGYPDSGYLCTALAALQSHGLE
uniref:E3 ubiquitin-protein ligase n=1 Tax=Callorhinchus milii TaxID=7868 RepID=A0A4W3H6T2_CALMI